MTEYRWSLFQIPWVWDPYNTAHAGPKNLDCSRDLATGRAEEQVEGRECLGFSRRRSSSTRSFHTGTCCSQLDLLCYTELQPLLVGFGSWLRTMLTAPASSSAENLDGHLATRPASMPSKSAFGKMSYPLGVLSEGVVIVVVDK